MKKGFTLIELMVVVAIMAILAIAGLSIFTTARQKAKDTRVKNDAKAYQQAAEQQFDAEAETYPASLTAADFEGSSMPSASDLTYSVAADQTTYCVYTSALNDVTAGNCGGLTGAGVCNWTGTTNFCAANVQ
jgi:prepilin-type N-terminal cleavage/methylation domain-containing protein